MGNKERALTASVFIDGFNVYFALKDYPDKSIYFNKYKWLNYRSLAQKFLPPYCSVVSVKYFTAITKWDSQKKNRHTLYIKALETVGVETIKGNYINTSKNVVIECPSSKKQFNTRDGLINGYVKKGYLFEEKKTDVNIAVHMIKSAISGNNDIILLFSNDTDFIPVFQAIKEINNKIQLKVVTPIGETHNDFISTLTKNNCKKLKEIHLKNSLLNDPITLKSGTQIHCPKQWKS